MLRQIRQRLLALIQRPVGRLGGLLVVAALVSAGIPSGELHAHADGYDVHEHVVVTAADDSVDQHGHTTPAEPDGIEVLHSHDACNTVSALPPIPAMFHNSGGLVAVSAPVPVASAPLTLLIPPYRPPIA